MAKTKLAVIGAGSVGATLAYAALLRGAATSVALCDINTTKVQAQALDIAHGIEFMPEGDIVGSDDIAVCVGADVVVVTAGAKQDPGQSRMDLAGSTIELMRTIVPAAVDVAPDAVFIMVTNPVDVVTYAALKLSGLPPRQLFGSGTVLDSSRLRYLLARECQVAVQNVHAYVVGEHGDQQFTVWSSATIGGVPVDRWPGLSEQTRERIAEEVKTSAYTIIEGKGATNYAIGVAGSRIVEAVLRDEHRVLPVSTLIDGYHGVDDVCLSVPRIVQRDGAGRLLDIPMSTMEEAALRASAEEIRATAAKFGF